MLWLHSDVILDRRQDEHADATSARFDDEDGEEEEEEEEEEPLRALALLLGWFS